jgi:hypothetical protein
VVRRDGGTGKDLADENWFGFTEWRLILGSLVLIDGNDAHRLAAGIGNSVASWGGDLVRLEVEDDGGSVANAFAEGDHGRVL